MTHGDFLKEITCDSSGASSYLWKNAEARVYEFDPQTVEKDECFVRLAEIIAFAGGYGPTSTKADVDNDLNGNL